MLNAKVRNNERARLESDTPIDKSVPQQGSSGDVAPLGLEDFLLGLVSINMPALRASELRPARAVPGPGRQYIHSSTMMGMLASLELPEAGWDFDCQGMVLGVKC
jgi:hypothetical protein